MIWRDVLANAVDAILFYKRRSIVTMFSLAWAVASFLILVSYGNGFDVAMRTAFTAIGQDIVFMANGQTSLQAGGMRAGRSVELEFSDTEAIRLNVPLVAAISPELMFTTSIVRGSREKQYMVRAVVPEYERVRNMRLDEGRWLNADDDRFQRRVAVIGATVSHELYGSRPFLGEEIEVNGIRFAVIGRLAPKVQIANYNRPDNECVFIPYQTMCLFRNTRYPDDVVWTPVAPSVREKAVKQVRSILAGLHRFSPADEKAVFIMEFSKFMSIIDGMTVALKVLLAFIGLVTLAIGGVGLANIMYTSVLERTTEIGVLKALGARRTTVLFQFLAEAVIIVVVGAVCGVALGVGIAFAIGSLPFLGPFAGEHLRHEGRLYFEIAASSIAISVGVLFTVGLIAAMLPAVRAARMDPIRALHYE